MKNTSKDRDNILDINQFRRRMDGRSRDRAAGRRAGRTAPSPARAPRRRTAPPRHDPSQPQTSYGREDGLWEEGTRRRRLPSQRQGQGADGGASGEKRRWGIIGMVLLVVLLTAAGIYLTLSGTLFSIQEVEFAGVVTLDQEELLELTGIRMGDNLLALDTAQVAERLSANPLLDVVQVSRRYPQTVYIEIQERQPWAVILSMGNYVVLNEDMLVIDVSMEPPGGQYPIIDGVLPTSYETGIPLELDDAAQQSALTTLLSALYSQGAAAYIDTIDLSNSQNITMRAEDGITIVVGNTDMAENKAMWIAEMLPRLEQQGYTSGTLRVGTGKDFSFIPDSTPTTPAPNSATTVPDAATPTPAASAVPSPSPQPEGEEATATPTN